MIADESVERVREAADIVEVIGEHVKLRRMGVDWRGPCPFHGGKNPNFAVSPRKGIYHCYKCGVTGDVITYLREREGLDFASAVRQLGERFGVEVRETDTRRDAPDERAPLWEVLGAAVELFQELLRTDESGAAARDYLASRHVEREAADAFGVGYAPRDGRVLRDRLGALGFGDARLLEVGLLVQREGESEVRPRFRDRLMFPITDAAGHPVGFGGRLMGPGEPKYLNSPETKAFSKGRLLYNMHQAKQSIRKEERVLLVEGYFDVLRLSAAGIGAAVAPLGTALTEAQAQLVARYTSNAFLLYDSDEAGLRATFRSGLELLRQGVAVRVVTLPEGEDPDSFVARHGGERMERQLAGAIDLFERQVQILERHGWFADLHRKRRAVDKLLPTIRAASDPLTRDLYLGRLGELAGVDRATLQREVDEPQRRGPGGAARPAGRAAAGADGAPPPDDAPSPWRQPRRAGKWQGRRGRGDRRFGDRREDAELVDARPPRPGQAHGDMSERYLVLAMLHLDHQIERIAEAVQPESFRNPIFAEIFSVLVERGEVGDVAELAEALSDPATAGLQRLLTAGAELDPPGRIVQDSLAQLRYLDLEEQLRAVEGMLEGASSERRAALDAERQRLIAERRALGARGDGWRRPRT